VVFGWVPFSSCHDEVVAVGFGDDFFSSFAPRLFGDDFFDLLWVVEVGARYYSRERRSKESLYIVWVLINMWSIMFQKIALFVGIILIVIAAVLLIGTSDANTSVVLGLLGIFVIGVFFLSKKKKWLVSNK
jgi:hypothetical protein